MEKEEECSGYKLEPPLLKKSSSVKKENRRKKKSEVKALGLLALFHGNTQIKSVRPSRPNVIGTEGIEWPKGDEEKNASIIITIARHHNMRLAGFILLAEGQEFKIFFSDHF